jgi:hypothetical protein
MKLHPFGDPQTVDITSVDGAVHVRWKVGAADDLTLLGIDLGVLPEDRVLLDGAITFDAGDGDAVAASDELHDYLLEHVGVTAGGQACIGEVTEVGDLVEDGAQLAFACPAEAAEATVSVSTLTDLHPAYRTLASGPDGQRAVYADDDETHDWALTVTSTTSAATSATPAPARAAAEADSGSGLGQSAALQMGAVGAVLLVFIAGAVAARRWMQRKSPPRPTPRRSQSCTHDHHVSSQR